MRKRRRVVEDSDSDSGAESDDGARVAGGRVQERLVAGRLATRKRKIEDSGSDDDGATETERGACEGEPVAGSAAGAGGAGGVRHQAAVAAVRRHCGGGGKRGWLA